MKFFSLLSRRQKHNLIRITTGLTLFIIIYTLPLETWFSGSTGLFVEFALFLIPYLIVGYDVLWKALISIMRGQACNENFLMSIATIGAFSLVLFPDSGSHMAEGAAVMLFYQVGEFFENYAVGRSRKSIADMMDIAPDYANIIRENELMRVDPTTVSIGDKIVIKPGERVPLDGIVISGTSQLDTAALTGESLPRYVEPNSNIVSGCINMTGLLTIEVTKLFAESTVSRILELVESASENKARTENFITRFARYYTPIVVIIAVILAVLPPLLFSQNWSDWIQRGLIFLVVSCPCALVISVPLSFFGGIGGASRMGILVKGSNYLEALASAETIVFDKTGTLTTGCFEVAAIHPNKGIDPELVLSTAAHAEHYSNHPIALSVKQSFQGEIDSSHLKVIEERGGYGIRATLDSREILVGNDKLMCENGIEHHTCKLADTVLHVSADNKYLGHIIISDILKDDAKQGITSLYAVGVKRTVMLTGDREEVASSVANSLGIDEYHAGLLPQDKVEHVEQLLAQASKKGRLVFIGDGINDAPVITRTDIGIAMGAMRSDAAIEAADIVLMDDKLSTITCAIQIARKTMAIVRQNIVFSLGIKFTVLILAIFGIANLWLAVFADVGVAVIAIINAMRAMKIRD